jgi:hypothetical protein
MLNGDMAQPHKGHRDAMVTRPHYLVGQEIRRRAAEQGVPYGDLISAILSEYIGLNHLAPVPLGKHTQTQQQELDLPAA